MTYAKPKHKTIEQNSQFYDQLSRVKRTGGQGSVLMRPTLNSRGTFVKRSVCGSPKALETSLMDKSGYRKDFESLKHMLKKQRKKQSKYGHHYHHQQSDSIKNNDDMTNKAQTETVI